MRPPYTGADLDLFAQATTWKAYWSSAVSPYVGSRVLEVGAGIGSTARYLCGPEQSSWLALEPDADLADRMRREQAEKRLPGVLDVRTGRIEDLPAERAFDTILYIDVLEHIEHDGAELVRAAARLRPGGHIVVLAPAHSFLFTPFDQAIGHFRRYDRASIRAVTPPGVAIVKIDYLDSVGLLASLGNRLLLKAALPTPSQIVVWDRAMVPLSRIADRLLAHRLGKSILAIWRAAA